MRAPPGARTGPGGPSPNPRRRRGRGRRRSSARLRVALGTGAHSSTNLPISSRMNISWRIRASVASVSARASAPAAGIIVRSSQASSEAARLRSLISPRRWRSSSNAPRQETSGPASASAYGSRRSPRGGAGEPLQPALVEAHHQRPKNRLHHLDPEPLLRLLGSDEGAASRLEHPAVVPLEPGAEADQARRPGPRTRPARR